MKKYLVVLFLLIAIFVTIHFANNYNQPNHKTPEVVDTVNIHVDTSAYLK